MYQQSLENGMPLLFGWECVALLKNHQGSETLSLYFLVNLEPRKLRGYESQGMILAADTEGHPVLLYPEREVPPGSMVR